MVRRTWTFIGPSVNYREWSLSYPLKGYNPPQIWVTGDYKKLPDPEPMCSFTNNIELLTTSSILIPSFIPIYIFNFTEVKTLFIQLPIKSLYKYWTRIRIDSQTPVSPTPSSKRKHSERHHDFVVTNSLLQEDWGTEKDEPPLRWTIHVSVLHLHPTQPLRTLVYFIPTES